MMENGDVGGNGDEVLSMYANLLLDDYFIKWVAMYIVAFSRKISLPRPPSSHSYSYNFPPHIFCSPRMYTFRILSFVPLLSTSISRPQV